MYQQRKVTIVRRTVVTLVGIDQFDQFIFKLICSGGTKK